MSALTNLRESLSIALKRFPGVVLSCIGVALAVTYAIHNTQTTGAVNLAQRMAMASALGVPLCFALRILRECNPTRIGPWLEWTPLPVIAFAYWTLPASGFDSPGSIILRWLLALAGLHFAVAAGAFIFQSSENRFWQFNRKIFLQFCGAALYCVILTAGMELALLSADKLFNLGLRHAYKDLFCFMAFLVHPLFFLTGVPGDAKALDSETTYPRALKSFTQFVLAPLAAVFTAILYVYAAKICVNRSWPQGWVALPVLILSAVGILATLLLHPLFSNHEERWARWFKTNFPRLLAPLSVLLLLALRERINSYGITEERYLGCVAGLWILTWSIGYSIRPEAGIRWIPASLLVLSATSAFGPWSAVTLSRKNQTERLQSLIDTLGLRPTSGGGDSQKKHPIPSKDYTNLKKTMEYLSERHGAQALKPMFPQVFTNKEDDKRRTSAWNTSNTIMNALNVVNAAYYSRSKYLKFRLAETEAISVEGFSTIVSFPEISLFSGSVPKRSAKITKGGLSLHYAPEELRLGFSDSSPALPVPLSELFQSLSKKSNSDLKCGDLQADWRQEGREFRILFTQLDLVSEGVADPTIHSCSFVILEKSTSR